MSFQEVTKEPTPSELGQMKRKYRKLQEKYEKLHAEFLQNISWENFEHMSSYDFIQLKEIYNEKKTLYWKIYALEHPNDKATKVAYDFLNSMTDAESVGWLQEHNLTTHQLIAEIANNPNFLSEVTA